MCESVDTCVPQCACTQRTNSRVSPCSSSCLRQSRVCHCMVCEARLPASIQRSSSLQFASHPWLTGDCGSHSCIQLELGSQSELKSSGFLQAPDPWRRHPRPISVFPLLGSVDKHVLFLKFVGETKRKVY